MLWLKTIILFFKHWLEPYIEEIRKFRVENVIVVWRVSYNRVILVFSVNKAHITLMNRRILADRLIEFSSFVRFTILYIALSW